MSKTGATTLALDADTGELKALVGPGFDGSGQIVTRWLYWLHMAQVFGLPMQIFVCIMGFVITRLSATGVYIWWKKASRAQILQIPSGASTRGAPRGRSIVKQYNISTTSPRGSTC